MLGRRLLLWLLGKHGLRLLRVECAWVLLLLWRPLGLQVLRGLLGALAGEKRVQR